MEAIEAVDMVATLLVMLIMWFCVWEYWSARRVLRGLPADYHKGSVLHHVGYGKVKRMSVSKIDPAEFQRQVGEWATYNWGAKRNPSQRALGVVEEIGELWDAMNEFGLLEAMIEFDDEDRALDDPVSVERRLKWWDDIADAGADAVIYLADLCEVMGWTLQPPDDADWNQITDGRGVFANVFANGYLAEADWLASLRKLSHSVLKSDQQIRTYTDHHTNGQHAVWWIVRQLEQALGDTRHPIHDTPMDLWAEVERTWAKVSLRDWKLDPVRGGESVA